MAENTNYQSESSLPIITTVDEIDHFRIINKNGQSQKATIAQVRELIPYVGENLVANSTMSSGAWYWFPSQYAMPIMVDIIKGRQYTVSFDVVGVDANDLVSLFMTATYGNEGGQHLLYLQVSQTGKRVSTTFIAAENFVKGSVLSFRGREKIGGTFANIKLELGTKATPYTPNPADIARAMDYSKLEEQIVPGEFWLDANGSKKQVYCKRIKISIGATTTKTSYGQIYLPGVTNIVHAYGNWSSGDNTFVIGQPNVNSDGVIVDTFRLNLTNDGQLWWMILTSIGMSITVNLFIKYTKE